ncbi:MAG: 50S ribosomal protein L11 methyltransferase [Pyrinomonadaceae bacterium]
MKQSEKDDLFAAHLPGVLAYHQKMLADGVRNRLLYKAIKQHVTSDTAFLDIGAGTGVWAILAAKLGAKRVVAVEIEECLMPVIYKLAKENGVADKIEIIHANANDLNIRGKFDVIVCELFGSDAIGLETVRSFVYVRDRFLAPAGVLIPQKLALMAAPLHFKHSLDRVATGLPLTTEFFKSTRLNYGLNLGLAERNGILLLAEPMKLVEIDFREIKEAPSLENLTATWNVKKLKKANAILTYSQSTFTNAIKLDSLDSQSWSASVIEFTPFEWKSGELQYNVSLNTQIGKWSVSLISHPEVKPQTFSPIFAFTRIRMAQQTTPHLKIQPHKTPSIKTNSKAEKK